MHGDSQVDLFCVRKDGHRFPVEVGTNPLEMEEGKYVLCAIVDITQRKLAEEEIKRINQELQRRNHEMQQFVYTISHDLKSPLVTCKGFVGLMKEDAVAGRWDVVLDSVGRIERAIQRMGDLIEDLLQLSRIGVIRNEPEEVHVGPMVRAIVDELAERLQQAGATIEIQPDLPNVMADRVRLAEVFENLLSNAIKYGCRGGNGHISVGGMTGPHDIRFFVRDNGPGIAREFHRKVFGLFQRLDSNQEGTGVGLAAVARIMETHGGRAWVESAPGEGASFWIAFPLTCDTATGTLDFGSPSPVTESLVTRG
jgi:signal transduction histidine kinase